MNPRKSTKKKAFTMVELMAILIILGLLATVVVTKVASSIDKARVTTTKTNLKLLHGAVIKFYMGTSRYPSEDEGLTVLVDPPVDLPGVEPEGYLETTDLPMDGWGNEFIYQLGTETGRAFEIISYGADGEEGGEGLNLDLYSTDAF